MKNIKHSDMVLYLKKKGDILLQEATAEKLDAQHMVIGLSGEVGEITDAVKKWAIYGKKIDRVNLVEELGDIEFFLEGLRQIFNISREETVEQNMQKLLIRYPNYQFSNENAINRKDK